MGVMSSRLYQLITQLFWYTFHGWKKYLEQVAPSGTSQLYIYFSVFSDPSSLPPEAEILKMGITICKISTSVLNKNVHPIQDFGCAHCDFKTSKKWNLKSHVRTVHEKVKDFACSACEYRDATQENSLASSSVLSNATFFPISFQDFHNSLFPGSCLGYYRKLYVEFSYPEGTSELPWGQPIPLDRFSKPVLVRIFYMFYKAMICWQCSKEGWNLIFCTPRVLQNYQEGNLSQWIGFPNPIW